MSILTEKIEAELEPLLHKEEFDFEALEDGLHELRRGLRWIIINTMALHDLFHYETIDQAKLSEGEQKIYQKNHDSKYTRFPTDRRGPYVLPTLAFYKLNKLVKDLGDIKDFGEMIHYISQAGVQIGVYANDEQAQKAGTEIFLKDKGESVDVQAETLKIYNQFKLDQFLDNFISFKKDKN